MVLLNAATQRGLPKKQKEEVAHEMRRILVLVTAAVIVAVMMAVTAGPSFAGFAKGQGRGSVSTNPGETVSDPKGDTKNNVANPQCDPSKFEKSKSPNGTGCNNN